MCPELVGDILMGIVYRTPSPVVLFLLYAQCDLPLWACLGTPKEPPASGAGPLTLGGLPGCPRRLFLWLAGFPDLSWES